MPLISTPPRPVRRRAHLRRAVAALLVGAVLTLAVAWIAQRVAPPMWDRINLAIAYKDPRAGDSPRSTVGFVVLRSRWQSSVLISQDRRCPFDEPVVSFSGLTPAQRAAAEQTRALLPTDDLRQTPIVRELGIRWARFPPSDPGDLPEIRSIGCAGFGWPCRAVSCGTIVTMQGRDSPLVARSFGQLETSVGRFAYRPCYRGFLADTIFYGAATWLALTLREFIRRTHRRRRGRCVHCGYDRAGLGTALCPECGR